MCVRCDIIFLRSANWRCFEISKIYLVRHGQTDANLHHIVQGQTDTPLNAIGMAQAKQVAKKLRVLQSEFVISSDLKRAKQTAEIIAKICQIPIGFDSRLREMRLGVWEGKTFEDLERDPSVKIWNETPSRWKMDGAETLEEVQKRMVNAIYKFAKLYNTLIVVSHGIAISSFVLYTKILPLDLMWEYLPDNASVVKVILESDLEGESLKSK